MTRVGPLRVAPCLPLAGRGGELLVLQQRQHRGRLAQPHVVGQAGAEAQALQHLEPGHPALLVGAELAGEPFGRGPDVERALQLAPHQCPQLTFGRDAEDGDAGLLGADARRHLEHLADGHGALRPGLGLVQEAHQAIHLGRPELHPLPAHVDQWRLQLGQAEELGLVDLLVAQRGLPVEGDDALLVEQAPGAGPPARGGRRRGLEAHAQPGRGASPPRRQQHAEPGHLQRRGGLDQEAMGAIEGQRETGRRGLAQRLAQLGVDPYRPAQFGQEDLVGRAERPAGPLELRAGPPDLFGRHDQAEVVGGLEEELQLPRRPFAHVTGSLVRPGVGSRTVVSHPVIRRLAQTQAQPEGPTARRGIGAPFTDELLHLGQLVRVGVHRRRRGRQGDEPGLQGGRDGIAPLARQPDERRAATGPASPGTPHRRRRPGRAGRSTPGELPRR